MASQGVNPSESDFLNWVVETARLFGWEVWHVPAPMRYSRGRTWIGAREAAGLPDLIMLRESPPRIVFAELKSPKGRPTEAQRHFLALAKSVGEQTKVVGSYLWRPGDEAIIETVLRSGVIL